MWDSYISVLLLLFRMFQHVTRIFFVLYLPSWITYHRISALCNICQHVHTRVCALLLMVQSCTLVSTRLPPFLHATLTSHTLGAYKLTYVKQCDTESRIFSVEDRVGIVVKDAGPALRHGELLLEENLQFVTYSLVLRYAEASNGRQMQLH